MRSLKELDHVQQAKDSRQTIRLNKGSRVLIGSVWPEQIVLIFEFYIHVIHDIPTFLVEQITVVTRNVV